MIAYASRTGTKRNLAALRLAGWRLLISATGVLRTEGFPYCIDNGAWTSHQNGTPFDESKYRRVVELLGGGADFVVLPDIVMGGLESLTMSLRWMEWTQDRTSRVLIPVQDGMTVADVAPYLAPNVGIFVGGGDPWKLNTTRVWSSLAHANGTVCHVGRINSHSRIRAVLHAGADSFDGKSCSMYSVNTPKYDKVRRELSIFRRNDV